VSGFEFAFTLFGLLLGLALVEGLSGLARAIKARHRVRIGWATALLGLFVACDVVTFWMYGWALRQQLEVSWPLMFGGFLVTAIYFICASLIFPDDTETDFDAHFDRTRPIVLGGILLCNLALLALTAWLVDFPDPGGLRTIVVTWSFFPAALLGAVTRRHKVAIACLIWLIATYPLSVVWN
jgi:hypothetical protein